MEPAGAVRHRRAGREAETSGRERVNTTTSIFTRNLCHSEWSRGISD